MRRGVKIFFLLILVDLWRTIYQPLHLFWLVIGTLVAPLFVVLLMALDREWQNKALMAGLQSIIYVGQRRGLKKAPVIWSWLGEMFGEAEWRSVERELHLTAPHECDHATALSDEQLRELAARGPQIFCGECHYGAGCSPPSNDGFDHPCHKEGGCPYGRKVL